MILLVDMDAFFASVEQARHPGLRGKPVIVCGDPGRRGVVTAASYEARPFGVRAGMPLQEARRLCPQAEFVEGHPDQYVAQSLELLSLYSSLSPEVEPFSVDEAFVGLERKVRTLDQAVEIARRLQDEIEARFGLTASIGVGPNKLIAKMASGLSKPRGLSALDEEKFRAEFWPRDVQELWGVGPKLAARMRSLGFKSVGELAHAPDEILKASFGIIGPQLKAAASGKDDTPLVTYHQGLDAKSMGHEVTLPTDCRDPRFLEGTLLRLADQVTRRLRAEGYSGRTVVLKLRNQRFETVTHQRALAGFTEDPARVYGAARSLFLELWNGDPVRLIGVSVTGLEKRSPAGQSELFDSETRSRLLVQALDRLRDRLGEASLVPAGSLTHRRRSSHVPFGSLSPRTPRRRITGEEPS